MSDKENTSLEYATPEHDPKHHAPLGIVAAFVGPALMFASCAGLLGNRFSWWIFCAGPVICVVAVIHGLIKKKLIFLPLVSLLLCVYLIAFALSR